MEFPEQQIDVRTRQCLGLGHAEDGLDRGQVLVDLDIELRHQLRIGTIAHGAFSPEVRTRSANHCA
jgi:hypothetical protein